MRNQIQAQQASLVGAVAHADYLQREVNRKTNLVKQDVVASSKLDDMRTQLTVAEQQIAQIRANLSDDPSCPTPSRRPTSRRRPPATTLRCNSPTPR